MVKSASPELDSVFAALADPTRRAIVARLARGEASVSEIAAPFPVSLPAVTKHLSVLRRAGIVEDRKLGRLRLCRLAPEPLRRAEQWVAQQRAFWDDRMDGLAAHLEAKRTPP
jgi:DNA-binding transcriptional ArsR family regulator